MGAMQQCFPDTSGRSGSWNKPAPWAAPYVRFAPHYGHAPDRFGTLNYRLQLKSAPRASGAWGLARRAL